MAEHVNLFDRELTWDADDPAGYRIGYSRIGPLIGAAALGATVYELPPGQSICPYHLEYGNEEWLLVLAGTPLLRTPEGERELAPGDVACFPEGPAGAHKVTNRTDETVRVAMVSTRHDPSLAVYPDSNKIGAWSGSAEHRIIARLGSDLDYWDGEL